MNKQAQAFKIQPL